MDRCSTGEVKATKNERPSVGVPCPARDGIVNQSSPDKNEHEEWAKATALSNSSDSEGGPVAQIYKHGDNDGDSNQTHVIAANISWYTQNRIAGMRVLPIDGWSRTPFKPKYSGGAR